jgi:allantoinase
MHDVGNLVVMPGLVDTHVHINEPGRTEWEGFESATRAAAAGGITTLVDMPLNSTPATTTVAALEAKRAAMSGKCHVDVGLWGGVVPGNAPELRALRAGGVLGFKCFMVPSGVDDFGEVGERELREALPIIAELGVPLLAHAESPEPILRASEAAESFDPSRYITYLRSRPVEAELQAIELLIQLSREYGARIHVVHVATGDAIPLLRDARDSGVPITAETCPHYLVFAAEEIKDGAFAWKCAPPIREARERDRLLDALEEGTLDLVASDHSPAPPAMKQPDDGSFFSAWGGIASLQLSLAATWTAALRRRRTPSDIARWMCEAPAKLAGLEGRKGAIARGHDADFTVWDPDARFTVDARTLQHRHKQTPYDGRSLSGVVRATYLRGRRIFHDGALSGAPEGALLTTRP